MWTLHYFSGDILLQLLSASLLISFAIFMSNLCGAAVQSDQLNEKLNKQEILWLVEDKVENRDLETQKSPESSTASYIENLIIQQLTQYDVKIERMTSTRISSRLKKIDNACVANRGNTEERKQYAIFSDPQSFYLTHKLYRFNQQSALPSQLFNAKGEIKSLSSVFNVLPTKIIGIAKGVSFGNFLNEQINQLNPANIYYRAGNQRVVAIESMLYKSRIDFVLALPVDITPNEEQKKLLEQYTIAGAPPYLIAHFHCSKSPLGQAIINDINKILAKLYQNKAFYQAHKRWFSDQELADLQIFLAEKFSENSYIIPH